MQTPHKPITLLILFWDLGLGGVQKKMTDIARFAETREGAFLNVHIVLRNKPAFRFDARQSFPAATIHYRPVFFRDIIHIPFSVYCLWQMIKTRPDTVLTFLDHASCIAIICTKLLFWRNINVVLNEDTFTSGHTASWIKRGLIALCYPMATRVITPTEASRYDLIRAFHVPSSKITVRPNWTLTDTIQINKRLKFDLLYVGRFAKQKNIPYLLGALNQIRKVKPKVTLRLVGDGQEKSDIQHLIAAYGLGESVGIEDSSHDVSSYLKQATIFVLSSWYEGMPVALLEAMATGVPAVTTDYPGASEYIIHGETGFIAKTKEEFVTHILNLMSDRTLRKSTRANAQRKLQKMYSHRAFKRYMDAVLYKKD